MNCNEVRELIFSFSNKELAEGEKPEVLSHIRKCEECAALLSKARIVDKYTEEFKTIAPSERVWKRIRNELIKEERQVHLNFLNLPLLRFAIPVAIVIIIIAVFLLNGSREKHDESLVDFISNQAEFIVSLETGDTTLYEPLSEEE